MALIRQHQIKSHFFKQLGNNSPISHTEQSVVVRHQQHKQRENKAQAAKHSPHRDQESCNALGGKGPAGFPSPSSCHRQGPLPQAQGAPSPGAHKALRIEEKQQQSPSWQAQQTHRADTAARNTGEPHGKATRWLRDRATTSLPSLQQHKAEQTKLKGFGHFLPSPLQSLSSTSCSQIPQPVEAHGWGWHQPGSTLTCQDPPQG